MGDDGYRRRASGGPRVRTDIVDVYVFRRRRAAKGARGRIEFLQLLRASEPLARTWHPVMGHIEKGETAVECAVRELREEVGIDAGGEEAIGFWALEQVHPYYVAAIDQIVLSPRFALQVRAGWAPQINEEHAGVRWVARAEVAKKFMWPGQAAACAEVVALVRPGSLAAGALRVRPESGERGR